MDRYKVYLIKNGQTKLIAETYFEEDAEAVLKNHPSGKICWQETTLVEKNLEEQST